MRRTSCRRPAPRASISRSTDVRVLARARHRVLPRRLDGAARPLFRDLPAPGLEGGALFLVHDLAAASISRSIRRSSATSSSASSTICSPRAPAARPSRRTMSACRWRMSELARREPRAYLVGQITRELAMALDDKTQTELEAAVFRRLVEHLRSRTDVQNIDLMNLAGFCRNCLGNWMKDAADAQGRGAHQGREPRAGLRHALRGVEGEAPEGSLARRRRPRSSRATSTDATALRGLTSVKQSTREWPSTASASPVTACCVLLWMSLLSP